jgi:hypothetical protein
MAGLRLDGANNNLVALYINHMRAHFVVNVSTGKFMQKQKRLMAMCC